MTHEAVESIELGQAEVLIEICWTGVEEMWDKFEPRTVPYAEFEGPSGIPSPKCT